MNYSLFTESEDDESTSPLPSDSNAKKRVHSVCDVCGGDGLSWLTLDGIKWTVADIRHNGRRWLCRVCRRIPNHGIAAEPQSIFLAFPELQPIDEETPDRCCTLNDAQQPIA